MLLRTKRHIWGNFAGPIELLESIGAIEPTDYTMRKTVLALLVALAAYASAQTPRPWEFGIAAGLTTYNGETNNIVLGQAWYGANAAFSLLMRKNISNNFAARMQLTYGNIKGDDRNYDTPAWRQVRGLSFTAPIYEMAAIAELYPFGIYEMKGKSLGKFRKAVSPYVALGIGGALSHPNVIWNLEGGGNEFLDPALADIDRKHRNKLNTTLPLGAGLRFRVAERWDIGAEAMARPMLSDYLDGISVAGDPGRNDWFMSLQLFAHYSFGADRAHTQQKYRRPSNADDLLPLADSDGDGVPDDKDECPETPGMKTFRGCPDTDHDGVPDRLDLCPEEPGLPSVNGCPDRDGDGIADKDDACPDMPGVEAYRGCPAVDRDKDGVADAEDLCPDMPGLLRWKGCPDTDGDGIPDNKDACPGIPGPEHLRGCPDSDDDGIADKDDDCPTIPGPVSNKGCPDIPLPPVPIRYKAVYFGSTMQEWHVTSLITLDEVVAIMEADPTLYARLEGHTDDTGREPANDLLAEKRAKKCLDHLVSKGVAAERLSFIGYGSRKPAVPNDSRQNRQLNRRVEIHFYRKG